MNTRTVAAIALVAGLVVETQGFAQVAIDTGTSASIAAVAATTSDPEQAARKFNVLLTIEDGSQSAPACIPPQDGAATTGESNNLTLGTCQTGVGNKVYLGCGGQDDCVPTTVTGPYIEFSEKRPSPIQVICAFCGSPVPNEPVSLQVAPLQKNSTVNFTRLNR
jgi:hypothetical protein